MAKRKPATPREEQQAAARAKAIGKARAARIRAELRKIHKATTAAVRRYLVERRERVQDRLGAVQRLLASDRLRDEVLGLFAGGRRDAEQLVSAGLFARVLCARRGLDVDGVVVQARWSPALGVLTLTAVDAQDMDDEHLRTWAREQVTARPPAAMPTPISSWRIDAAGQVLPVCARARRQVALHLEMLEAASPLAALEYLGA